MFQPITRMIQYDCLNLIPEPMGQINHQKVRNKIKDLSVLNKDTRNSTGTPKNEASKTKTPNPAPLKPGSLKPEPPMSWFLNINDPLNSFFLYNRSCGVFRGLYANNNSNHFSILCFFSVY